MARKKKIKRTVKAVEAADDSLAAPASLGDPEYEKIFLDFLSKKISLADLARTHEVDYKKLYNRYKKENWKAWREEYRKKVAKKTFNRMSNTDSRKLLSLMNGADKLNDLIAKIIDDEDQLYLYVDKDGNEIKIKKANTSYLMEMALLLKQMTDVTSKIYGILPALEERKIELEQQKVQNALAKIEHDSATGDENSGVIILPAMLPDGDDEDIADE